MAQKEGNKQSAGPHTPKVTPKELPKDKGTGEWNFEHGSSKPQSK